jgi:hypothetical protein
MWNRHLKHTCIAIATYATSYPFATSRWNTWNTWNIRLKQLKHLKHILATYVCSHCNIQMKHLKTTSKTHLKTNTWRRRQPWPTWWWTAVANKQRSGAMEIEDGGRQAAGRGEERRARSSRRGPRRVGSKNSEASGEWRWGDRKASGGVRTRCSTPLHCDRGGRGAATRSWWSKPRRCRRGELVREWMRKQRRFEKKVRAVIFNFYFRTDDSVACWAVRASRTTDARLDEMDALPTALSKF